MVPGSTQVWTGKVTALSSPLRHDRHELVRSRCELVLA